jgi:hypothetical protein
MRFNTQTPGTKTFNLAGGDAYKESPELELVSILLTSFANDQFYEKAEHKFENISALLKSIDPLFAAKAGIYARTEFGMRSISHVLASELAPYASGKEWARKFYNRIVYRLDDMTEIVSYLKSKGQKLPSALKRGFADAFSRFDEYQIAKYRNEGKFVKLVDIVNLVHPAPDGNEEALRKLIKGELKSTETWESKLTQAGQKASSEEEKAELKKEAWTSLIKERKIGYFALLRNLCNILTQAPELVSEACALLTDESLIKKSLVLPFRFFTAINELEQKENSRNIVIALSKAAEISLNNVPELPGKTLIAVDVSGSMRGRPADIARMFGAVLYKSMDSVLLIFAETARFVTLNPADSVLSLTKNIPFTGGGTDFNTIFDTCSQAVDRIIILSDIQAWMKRSYYSNNPKDAFREYKQRTNSNPLVYSFDLAGHGTLQFPEHNVYCLAGFSDKVFNIMKLLESDRNALVNKIKQVEL